MIEVQYLGPSHESLTPAGLKANQFFLEHRREALINELHDIDVHLEKIVFALASAPCST